MMWKTLTREERCARIMAGVADYKTTSMIAEEIGGCTRNAIIGFAHRRGIGLLPHGLASSIGIRELLGKPKTPRQQRPKPKPAPRQPQPRPAPVIPIAAAPKHVPSNPVPFLHLRQGLCAWPLWSDDTPPDQRRCCGAPSRPGRSYCAAHHRIGTVRKERPRKQREAA